MATLLVPVIIKKGSKSSRLRGFLDTGAELTMISSTHAQKLGLPKKGKGYMVGAGGRFTFWGAKVSDIQIPGTRCSSGPMMVAVYDERAFPMGGLTGFSAIIGFDFMRKTRMNIAAAAKTGAVSCARRLADLLDGPALGLETSVGGLLSITEAVVV